MRVIKKFLGKKRGRLVFLLSLLFSSLLISFQLKDKIEWKQQVLVQDVRPFKDLGKITEVNGTVQRSSGLYGAQYGRLLALSGGEWLAAYTVSRNNGYQQEPDGGLTLEVAKSIDHGKNWQVISEIKDPGRDLDNAQMIEKSDGSLLLACRSVRWQESYILPVYSSSDGGRTWSLLSEIDSHKGKPGALGNPDQGMYEPHMLFLNDGRLSVMYASEKYAKSSSPYSQVISQKISDDGGRSWLEERKVVYDDASRSSRPGMPVWTKMRNGSYLLVYEICGPQKCNVFYKVSKDGVNWPNGFGNEIADQLGGPYVLSLHDGRLLVTSNSSKMSLSTDYGETWMGVEPAWAQTLWPSLYQFNADEVVAVNSVARSVGGHNIQLKFGKLTREK
ncbi:hypothetical protein RYH73_25135 [Olivibacter sp. CPCC 100613]|uniref:hypothetical protein n=1 Tax=Olivibacter sp. CPCC 100613 TaxID=3079931 RepID=UPI002FFB74FC